MFADNSISKYRPIWLIGIIGLFSSICYTVYYGEWMYWLASYIYFRVLWFFTNGIGLHRYFAHRTFKTGPLRHQFLCWISVLGGAGSPFSWAIHHRHHHRHSDTENDLHSPKFNKFLSFTGLWAILPLEWWQHKQVNVIPRDLYRDKTVMFINHNYSLIWFLIFTLSILIDWKFCLFFVMAPVGWNLLHGSVTNCLSHMKLPGSYRNHNTLDNSYNNTVVNWYLLGEGLHNNHHAEPGNYNQAHAPGEFDLGAWIIKKFFYVT